MPPIVGGRDGGTEEMKDCNGAFIGLNSTLMCINDVNYGDKYKVVNFGDGCPLLGIQADGIFFPLKDFDTDEQGRLVDFERMDHNNER